MVTDFLLQISDHYVVGNNQEKLKKKKSCQLYFWGITLIELTWLKILAEEVRKPLYDVWNSSIATTL